MIYIWLIKSDSVGINQNTKLSVANFKITVFLFTSGELNRF